MQIVTITAAYSPDAVLVAASTTFDMAVHRINEKLQRAYDRDIGHPDGWTFVPVPDNGSVIRSTPLGNVKFRVERHNLAV